MTQPPDDGLPGDPVVPDGKDWTWTLRERCPECGSVYKMEYVGPQDDGHGHDHGHGEHDIHHSSDGAHNYEGEPVTMADFIKPEYR